MSHYNDRFIFKDEIEKMISERKKSINSLNGIFKEISEIDNAIVRNRKYNHWQKVPEQQLSDLKMLIKGLSIANENYPKGLYESELYSL